MALLDSLKDYVRNRKLAELKRRSPVQKSNDAHTIGILFNAEDLNQRDVVIQFLNQLKKKKKKVSMLGYIGELENTGAFVFKTYNKKSLNWIQIPTDENVENFRQQEFDILINLFIDSPPHVEYIIRSAQAKLIVGSPVENQMHDLMLESKNKHNLSAFIKEITILLDNLSGAYVN